MEDKSINEDSGASGIYRLVKQYGDNLQKDTVKDLYDTIMTSYDESHREIRYAGPDKAVAILNEYCPDKSISVLDCGCGTGLVGEKLYKLGYNNVVGVDFSQKSLAVAEQKRVYKKLICTEISAKGMPFKDSEFDVVICSGCIAPGHISPKCFPEWTRIVKPGGFVIITMRRCYVELQKDLEGFYAQNLGESFNIEIRNLEIRKKWEVTLRLTFAGYIYHHGILNDGIAVVCKVL